MIMINQYVFGLLMATVAIGGLLFASIVNTTAQDLPSCDNFPITYFEKSETGKAQNAIKYALGNATKRITIAMSEANALIFNNFFKESLKNTKVNKKNIQIILPYDASIKKMLNSIGLNYTYQLQTVRNQHNFNLIVADDSGFIAPFLSSEESYSQLVAFDRCKIGADDLQAFVDFFVHSERDDLPTIIPSTMQAKTSPIMPVVKDKSKFYTFYNHDDILFPLRLTTNYVLNSTFESEPKNIMIFTQSHPVLSAYTGYESTQFSLYMNIKALLMRRRTNIRFLARNETVFNEKSAIWCKSLGHFSNISIKVYKEDYAGPNFMIADDWVYVFSQPIKSHDINEKISLHYTTNDKATLDKATKFFNEAWNTSVNCTI